MVHLVANRAGGSTGTRTEFRECGNANYCQSLFCVVVFQFVIIDSFTSGWPVGFVIVSQLISLKHKTFITMKMYTEMSKHL